MSGGARDAGSVRSAAGLVLHGAGFLLAVSTLSDLAVVEPTVDAVRAASRASTLLLVAGGLGAAGALLLPRRWSGLALAVPPVLAVAADAAFHNSLLPHAAVAAWLLALLAVAVGGGFRAPRG